MHLLREQQAWERRWRADKGIGRGYSYSSPPPQKANATSSFLAEISHWKARILGVSSPLSGGDYNKHFIPHHHHTPSSTFFVLTLLLFLTLALDRTSRGVIEGNLLRATKVRRGVLER